jgi:hypothetical protein
MRGSKKVPLPYISVFATYAFQYVTDPHSSANGFSVGAEAMIAP